MGSLCTSHAVTQYVALDCSWPKSCGTKITEADVPGRVADVQGLEGVGEKKNTESEVIMQGRSVPTMTSMTYGGMHGCLGI